MRINDVSMRFGATPLLDHISLQIEPGERIGLIGRNGTGKTTLLKLLAGALAPDTGEIAGTGNVRVSLLRQDVPDDLPGSIYDVVAGGGAEDLSLLRQYHDLTQQVTRTDDEAALRRLEHVQHQIETSGAWSYHQRVETVIGRTGLDENAQFRNLSAGMKRRVFLARALAGDPDLLLLDEPTNHLDITTILWLEDFLLKYDRTLVFVTHDRAFLRRLATRIVEIDRGKTVSYSCNYTAYLERRQAMLDAEEGQWRDFDKKLAKEEVWIRQGIRARRTRNEGRVRALQQMRSERAKRQEQMSVSRFDIQEAERSGRMVADARDITFSWDSTKIVEGFTTTIMRGDKIGVIGPNGAGKTTLLKLLLGEIRPDRGSVRVGSGVVVAYFDQLRAQLDEAKTVSENVADGNDRIVIGTTTRHVIGYLQDFLFAPERTLSPVRTLSGGERNRLLLAKLFAAPSNVLVMDEPTNDLDAETLDLLEDRLLAYKGTILMVSHDREFLNNVVTSTIVFEGEGRLQEYVGGYDDWLMQRQEHFGEKEPSPLKEQRQKIDRPAKEKRKLSFKEARELEALPAAIEGLEKEKDQIVTTLSSATFYEGGDFVKVSEANDRLQEVERQLDEAYRRWDELETLAAYYATT